MPLDDLSRWCTAVAVGLLCLLLPTVIAWLVPRPIRKEDPKGDIGLYQNMLATRLLRRWGRLWLGLILGFGAAGLILGRLA
jgi:hypothetical protein